MKKNMESRRGVALAEVVIALVVITIISVATLSVMFSSVQIENKTIVAMDVRNQAENAIECFRFAKSNVETFIACLNQTEVEKYILIEQKENVRTYELDKGGYKTTITVTTETQTEQKNGINVTVEKMVGFHFEAVYDNAQSDDSIYKFDFPKSSENTNAGGNAQ